MKQGKNPFKKETCREPKFVLNLKNYYTINENLRREMKSNKWT